jgi:hypothetical protein
MHYNINCRLCHAGHYEPIVEGNDPRERPAPLIISSEDPGAWVILECTTCGNIQVCRATPWWRDKV